MTFRIDDDEYEILAGDECSRISQPAKLVYLLGIRPRMNYDTGIAGEGRGAISYQGLWSIIEYFPPKGSTNKPLTYNKQALRAIFGELERAGLVRWIRNEERGLFFECLLAARNSSSEMRNNPRTTPEQPQNEEAKNNPGNPLENNDKGDREQPQASPKNNPKGLGKNNPYQDSGNQGVKGSKSPLCDVPVLRVFEHWKTTMNHPRAALDDKRKKLIVARLKDYTAEDLCRAIDGNKASAWHQGKNPDNKVFDGLDLILRDAGKVDAFIAIAESKPAPRQNPADARREAAKAMLFGGGERVIQGEVIR